MKRRSFLSGLIGSVAGLVGAKLGLIPAPTPTTNLVAALPTDSTVIKVAAVAEPLFKKGDVIFFDGVYNINPRTRKPTNLLTHFVVTEDVTSADNIPIYPQPIGTGTYQNVTRKPTGKPLALARNIPLGKYPLDSYRHPM